jgi:hypothetical protein
MLIESEFAIEINRGKEDSNKSNSLLEINSCSPKINNSFFNNGPNLNPNSADSILGNSQVFNSSGNIIS